MEFTTSGATAAAHCEKAPSLNLDQTPTVATTLAPPNVELDHGNFFNARKSMMTFMLTVDVTPL